MSMAMVLEHAREWLREKNGWHDVECNVTFDAMPPLNAGQFFVGIDDAGVEGGNDSTEDLKEVYTITIGIWRRPEHLALNDKRGLLKLPTDKYLAGSHTLHSLERKVIIPKFNGLHKNYVFVKELNSRFKLPDKDWGAPFSLPLCYRGRGRMETIAIDKDGGGTNSQPWYGYRLRFRGLHREQVVNNSNYAIG